MSKKRRFEDLPDVLRIDDIMDYLQICKCKVYQMLRSGEIPSIKIGANYRIPKQMFLYYLSHACSNESLGDPADQRKGDAVL